MYQGSFPAAGDDLAEATLAAEVLNGLENDAFEIFYQDICSVATGQTITREALLRWRDPASKSAHNIQALIEVAEASGLIVPLGQWVLKTACHEAAAWQDDCSVAVNVSPKQLSAGDFLSLVAKTLADTGLPPRRLEIEITETAVLAATAIVVEQLDTLARMGVRLSLDDFGVGYSSLKHLRLPFSTIKLDGSFVRDAEHDYKCRMIVRGLSDLARHLSITTVAEGIETARQLELVRSAGVTLAQGNLIGPPLRNQALDSSRAVQVDRLHGAWGLPPVAAGTPLAGTIALPVEFMNQLASCDKLDEMLGVVAKWSTVIFDADRASITLAALMELVSALPAEPADRELVLALLEFDRAWKLTGDRAFAPTAGTLEKKLPSGNVAGPMANVVAIPCGVNRSVK